ncbi:MAG TPA: ABC transporter [Lachnospiraceae bacterium]|nr:ABC transporter [Lachnospiraceae bacterium]
MILSCHNITKAFGTDVVLKNVSFHIEEHEKAAIVGINGAGKSTLLKIIVGEITPDSGEVTVSRGRTLGYLAQINTLSGHRTIWDETAQVKQKVIDMEESLRTMERQMSTVSEDSLNLLMDQYHKTQEEYERLGGYAWKSEVSGVLKGLGFTEEEFGKPADSLSGGQKTRVALGKLLLQAPDILLLDEPINHLDLNSIEWLENYLLNYQGSVIVVAHDRYFLNKVVTKVVEIDNGTSMSFSGNYSAYAEKKRQLRETQLKSWMNQQAEIRHQEAVIEKLKSFNREKSIKRAESREKMLNKIERIDKPAETDARMHLQLTPRILSGNDVLTVEHLKKGFEYPLFTDLNLEIRRGERVCMIGNNGTGKSTFLKLIIGSLKPDEGSIRLGTRVHIGYYDQEHQTLHPDKTLFSELQDAYPTLDNTTIRNTLASFLFTGDDVFKRVSDLSGGERGRLSLAKLMLSESNFLILDEPTNHLDILSKEILEDALQSYSGTVLCVSHDRYFINRVSTRIIELTNRVIVSYLGNYDYYLEKKDELTAKFAPANEQTIHSASGGQIASGNASHLSMQHASGSDAGAENWKRQKELQAEARKKENRLKKLEAEISGLEARSNEIDEEMSREEVFTDVGKVTSLSKEKAALTTQLEVLYNEWSELAE